MNEQFRKAFEKVVMPRLMQMKATVNPDYAYNASQNYHVYYDVTFSTDSYPAGYLRFAAHNNHSSIRILVSTSPEDFLCSSRTTTVYANDPELWWNRVLEVYQETLVRQIKGLKDSIRNLMNNHNVWGKDQRTDPGILEQIRRNTRRMTREINLFERLLLP
jgi:hypothetical protein